MLKGISEKNRVNSRIVGQPHVQFNVIVKLNVPFAIASKLVAWSGRGKFTLAVNNFITAKLFFPRCFFPSPKSSLDVFLRSERAGIKRVDWIL